VKVSNILSLLISFNLFLYLLLQAENLGNFCDLLVCPGVSKKHIIVHIICISVYYGKI